MEVTKFLGFGQISRPDIGLIADGVQNLAEIYESDKRNALRNISLNPEALDVIYGLSDTISREDLRAVSGLSTLLLPTLDMQDEVFNERLNKIINVDQIYASSKYQLGVDPENSSLRGDLIKSPNVIIYNGSIQCESVEYMTNLIGERLYTAPERRLTSISTSRASLFNSEGYPSGSANVGYFKSASLSGSVRVRRRSHVNKVYIPKTSYIPRVSIKENPSHEVKCYISNGVTGTPKDVRLLATKNSPTKLFCRMATGKIKFTFTEPGIWFYGYQVQPVQSTDIGETPAFLDLPLGEQVLSSDTYELNIDVTRTGYANSRDLYLYLYMNIEKIKGLEISGIDIKDFIDGKDIGLIGFNNLENLVLSGTSIKIFPIWLKTLKTKLKTLDFVSDGDTYRNGPMGWFDIRNPAATPNASHPLYTAVSYLTIPKKGTLINEDKNGWGDSKFEKYILNQSRVAGTDYRQFSNLQVLNLGDRFYGRNPRFDDVFPNLTFLNWEGKYGTSGVGEDARIFGTPPKINNNGQVINYSIDRSGASGTLEDIGTSTTLTDDTVNGPSHISKYRMGGISVSGKWPDYMEMAGGIALDVDGSNNSSEWLNWLNECFYINVSMSRITVNLQPDAGIWRNLIYAFTQYSGGVKFKAVSEPLKTPNLRMLYIYGSENSTGQLPSLGDNPAIHTNELESVILGNCNTIDTVTVSSAQGNSYEFILPSNFAPARSSNYHKLTQFWFSESLLQGRFRAKDFQNLYSLSRVYLANDYNIKSRFPLIPTTRLPETESKPIYVDVIAHSGFYDLSPLDITPSNAFFARSIESLSTWYCNYSSGGTRLPQLVGTPTTPVKLINMSAALRSQYPGDWYEPSKQNAFIDDSHPYSVVDNLTVGKDIFSTLDAEIWDPRDDLYYLSGTNLNTKVLPGDTVHATPDANSPVLATVLDVIPSRVVVDTELPGSLTPVTYYFFRHTQSINDWFKEGFNELNMLLLENCRLSGSINIRSGFSKLKDNAEGYPALNLSYNVLTGYTRGFENIFSGENRKITLNLANNAFGPSVMRSMLQELVTIDSRKKFTDVTIKLNTCNFITQGGYYTEYTQEDIFPTTIQTVQSGAVNLVRNETIKLYETIPLLNQDGSPALGPNGAPLTTKRQVGTTIIQVPGEYVDSLSTGIDYNSSTGNAPVQTQKATLSQQIVENSLAIQYKRLNHFKINLGFTYQAPNTTPTPISTEYSGTKTRRQTIEDLGYAWNDVVLDV